MNLNPWMSPRDIYDQKMGLKDVEDNARMKRGRDLEPRALESFKGFLNLDIVLEQPTLESNLFPFMIASLDGFNEENKILVEIKCAGKSAHVEACNGHIPDYYKPQLQHQLFVTGLEKMWYYSFDGKQGVALEVTRDEEFITKMVEMERWFYEGLISFTPPENENMGLFYG